MVDLWVLVWRLAGLGFGFAWIRFWCWGVVFLVLVVGFWVCCTGGFVFVMVVIAGVVGYFCCLCGLVLVLLLVVSLVCWYLVVCVCGLQFVIGGLVVLGQGVLNCL